MANSARKLELVADNTDKPPYQLADMETCSSELVWITPPMARELRADCHFMQQRDISEQNVARLAGEMASGSFVIGTPVLLCRTPDGRRYIVNGNHTLEAISAAGVSMPLTMITLHVDSMREVGMVYAVQDNQKPRTWNDRVVAYGLLDSMPYASRAAAAVRYIELGFQNINRPTSVSKRLKLCESYHREMRLVADCLRGGAIAEMPPRLLRACVLAVMLETLRHAPAEAHDFWHAVACDTKLRGTDPRAALRKYLLAMVYTGNKFAYVQSYRACAQAWNAWWQGEALSKCTPQDVGKFVLHGTPYTEEHATAIRRRTKRNS